MNSEDTRNLFLAIALSVLVLGAWQYFYAGPLLERQHQAQTQANKEIPKTGAEPSTAAGASPQTEERAAGAIPGTAAPTPGAPAVETVSDALKANPRVTIDTPSLGGSIDLKGGKLDDLVLKDYHETIDKKSPLIRLFSPSGAPDAYWSTTGIIGAGGDVKTPTLDTIWTADVKTLTPSQPLTLTWDNGAGLLFKKVFAVDDKYMFTVTDSVTNSSGASATLRPYGLVLRHGMPQVAGYSVLHEGFEGVIGDQEHAPTYATIDKAAGKAEAYKGNGGWLGFTDKYWASAVIPEQTAPLEARYSASGNGQPVDYQADFISAEKAIAPGASFDSTTRVFAGAKEVSTIYDYQSKYGIEKFNLMIDWGWFYFITQPMYWLIDTIYKFVGNFGVAILIVTVLVKLVFFPLANRSYNSMAKMKKIQPQIAALKDLYPDDKVKQQQEQMELFKKEGVNPVAGCLPMVIQIPVFFALYKVIFITIEMRHAPFFGWIKDLSAPDPTNVFTLFGLIPWNPTALPVFGHFLALGIWPLIMGVSMFFQMKMNPEPADPVQKSMFAWMPVIFTFMLGTFPAGLVIYWTWNNTLTILQQYYIMTKAGVKVELWDNLTKLFPKKSSPAKTPSV
jgi:YidC/Oxa1 family membrane protein insertase